MSGCETGGLGKGDPKVQTSRDKSWMSPAADTAVWYMYSKVVKRVNPKSSHHKEKTYF